MIIIFGILSIFQLSLLPGVIALSLARLNGRANYILFAFPVSMIVNFMLVFVATIFRIYYHSVVLLFFFIELFVLALLTRPVLISTIGPMVYSAFQSIRLFLKDYLLEKLPSKSDWIRASLQIFYVIVLFWATYQIVKFSAAYIGQRSSIFVAWDAVVSWDRWAVDWYHNMLPRVTWHYPQLIPANWSLSYQLIGDSRVKLFAKNLMGLIEIYVLVSIFVLGIVKKQNGYFLGVIFTAWLQTTFGSQGNGYADTAVAFFTLSSIICISLAADHQSSVSRLHVYLGAVCAAGAALTKQAGLWIVFIYPILLTITSRKEDQIKTFSYYPRILLIYLLLIGPWYGYKEYQIHLGDDFSEIQYVTTFALQGMSFLQRLVHALDVIKAQPLPQLFRFISNLNLLLILLLFSTRDRFMRSLVILVIIPFTLVWALYFSYDTRNLNLVIPLVGMASGFGLQSLITYFQEFIFFLQERLPDPTGLLSRIQNSGVIRSIAKFLGSIRLGYLLAVLIMVLFLLPVRYSDTYMVAEAIAKQKQIGDTVLNEKLYKYKEENGLDGKILTDYQYLGYLPELGEYYQLGFSSIKPDQFIDTMNRPEIGYILVRSDWMHPKVAAYINRMIVRNRIKLIFEYNEYEFLTACHDICNK